MRPMCRKPEQVSLDALIPLASVPCFGAMADDGIDDRVPIQEAIDAATNAGGGTVCLSSGRW